MTLVVEQLNYERNYQLLLNDIHFELQAGQWLQISGANGSGKSTLLRILAGFLDPLSGKLSWKNQIISTQKESYQQQLHFIGHQHGVKPYLTVLENLKLAGTLANITSNLEHIQQCAEKMGLPHLLNTYAFNLSAGQMRRLALARLLLSPAPLWILDEPTTALDQAGQALLVNLLNQHLAQGGMAIVATHQQLAIQFEKKSIQLGEQNV
jgi:heme exporter protein A